MIVIGVGVAYLGYAAGVWGYCLIRGYNVTGPQLFGKIWPGPAKASLQPVNLQDGSNGLQNINLQSG